MTAPRRPLTDEEIVDRMIFDEGLEEALAMTPEDVAADNARAGIDAADVHAAITAALARAGLPALGPPGDSAAAEGTRPTAEGGKVVSLRQARERRAAPTTRWVALMAAAAAALVFGGGGTQALVAWRPTPTVTYPAHTSPPTAAQVARMLRARATWMCEAHYWGDCLDTLDAARQIDPDGDRAEAVQRAREQIEEHLHQPERPGDSPLMSKPPVGPGDRPLKKK